MKVDAKTITRVILTRKEFIDWINVKISKAIPLDCEFTAVISEETEGISLVVKFEYVEKSTQT